MLYDTLDLARRAKFSAHLAYSGPRTWFEHNSPDFALFAQEGADLGERLDHSMAFLLQRHTPVLCIGSDSPHLPLKYLIQALTLLQEFPVVLGPAQDGGYYLVGLSRFQPLFRGMPMSTPHLLNETCKRSRELGLEVGLLPLLADLDTWADVETQRPYLPTGHTAQWLNQWEAERR